MAINLAGFGIDAAIIQATLNNTFPVLDEEDERCEEGYSECDFSNDSSINYETDVSSEDENEELTDEERERRDAIVEGLASGQFKIGEDIKGKDPIPEVEGNTSQVMGKPQGEKIKDITGIESLTGGVTFPTEVGEALKVVSSGQSLPSASDFLDDSMQRSNETTEMYEFRKQYALKAIERGLMPNMASMLGQAQLNITVLGVKYPDAITSAINVLNRFIYDSLA